jgi:hypothetical protein
LAVKAGVGAVLILGGILVGDQGFDVFGRKPKAALKMKMPESWPFLFEPPK